MTLTKRLWVVSHNNIDQGLEYTRHSIHIIISACKHRLTCMRYANRQNQQSNADNQAKKYENISSVVIISERACGPKAKEGYSKL